jgi:biopolymer transport protein TolQ
VPHDQSIWSYFFNAGPVVKLVMLLLLTASVISWTMIFQRATFLKKLKRTIAGFEEVFWSGIDLSKLYTDMNAELAETKSEPEGLESIFQAGFREFMRLHKQGNTSPQLILETTQRAMRIARAREMEKLEQHLSFLATVGSTSPYVGLFGTVWGIMTSFQALGGAQQMTIATVAPGISEALVATAMGLFAAIPAVIAYNRYANEVERLLNHYDTFQEEFSSILYRQANAITTQHSHYDAQQTPA